MLLNFMNMRRADPESSLQIIRHTNQVSQRREKNSDQLMIVTSNIAIHLTLELLNNFLFYNYSKLLNTFSVFNFSKFINC